MKNVKLQFELCSCLCNWEKNFKFALKIIFCTRDDLRTRGLLKITTEKVSLSLTKISSITRHFRTQFLPIPKI